MGKRRRIGGPKNWSCCHEVGAFLDCRCLPHGFYSLIPAVLSSMAFWTALVQDGCDFAKLEGENVEKITGSDVLPFIEAGISHYRAPLFYTTESEWKMVFTDQCENYPGESIDIFVELAKYFSLVSLIFGGSLTLFLWFTTCMTFSIRTWRFCAVEAALATLFRGGSFLFLFSSICEGNESQCHLAFGSRMDIIGIVLYFVAAVSLFGHYPDPKLRRLTDEEIIQSVADAENLQPKRLSSLNIPPPSNLGGGESNRYRDDPSYYGGDGRSVASQSFYNKGYGDEQSVAQSHYSRGQHYDDADLYDGGRSVASQSHFPSNGEAAFV